MAKIRYGGPVADASGSVGGFVLSRNRSGAYARARTKPTLATTPAAQLAKARFGETSAGWSGLSDEDQAAWKTYGANLSIMDRLGVKQTLDGHAAYVHVNGLLAAMGQPLLPLPVPGVIPDALVSGTVLATAGTPSLSLTFTEDPLGTNDVLCIRGALVDSGARRYVKNLLRQFYVSAKAATGSLDLLSAWTGRFGSLVAGTYVHLEARVLDTSTGLISQVLAISGQVTHT